MDGSIGRLRCRYRIAGPTAEVGRAASRLDGLVKERLVTVIEAALEEAFGADPTVYVIRHVSARVPLKIVPTTSDEQLAQRWGRRLAVGILRTVAEDEPGLVVRYDDHADYVAHFAADLLLGQAWERWYYRSFSALRAMAPREALRQVLFDHPDDLPSILAGLRGLDALEPLLAALDEEAQRQLWAACGGREALTPEALRPLFTAALDLAGRLGLWTGVQAGHAEFDAYLSTRPTPADWRDPRSLAQSVAEALGFLARRGWLAPPFELDSGAFQTRLSAALADIDWLDTALLGHSLQALLASLEAGSAFQDRPAGGATPRQRQLLVDLLGALQAGGVRLDPGQPESAANALRLLAALAAHQPGWTGDSLAGPLISRLLAAWGRLLQSSAPGELLARLHAGDLPGALQLLPLAGRERAAADLQSLTRLGKPGMAVVEQLVQAEGTVALIAHPRLDSPGAGAALLLRAVQDARLPALFADHADELAGRVPPKQGWQLILLGLLLRFAGPEALQGGEIDPGLRWLAGDLGLEDGAGALPASLDELSQALAEASMDIRPPAQAEFAAAWLELLSGQRLLAGRALHLFRLQGAEVFAREVGADLLVAGDGSGLLWPLGQMAGSGGQVDETLAIWLEAWREAAGEPAVILGEPGLAASLPEGVSYRLVAPEDAHAQAVEHFASRQRLLDDLAALGHALLCTPQAGLPALQVNLILTLLAITLLRLWARWLRNFSESSLLYLLQSFVRRSGVIEIWPEEAVVRLEAGPLDMVLEMAGYLAPLEGLAWLEGRRVVFQTGGV